MAFEDQNESESRSLFDSKRHPKTFLYRNVFLEDYSELEMEIAELDTLIEDLSAYMQSTGRKYADHAATLRNWSALKKRQQKPGAGIPDYTYNKEESL